MTRLGRSRKIRARALINAKPGVIKWHRAKNVKSLPLLGSETTLLRGQNVAPIFRGWLGSVNGRHVSSILMTRMHLLHKLIDLINNPRHTCLGTSYPRQHCLDIHIRYLPGSKLKTFQTLRGRSSSVCTQCDSCERYYSPRDARGWTSSMSSSPGWPEPVFLRDKSSLGIYEYLLMYLRNLCN